MLGGDDAVALVAEVFDLVPPAIRRRGKAVQEEQGGFPWCSRDEAVGVIQASGGDDFLQFDGRHVERWAMLRKSQSRAFISGST